MTFEERLELAKQFHEKYVKENAELKAQIADMQTALEMLGVSVDE